MRDGLKQYINDISTIIGNIKNSKYRSFDDIHLKTYIIIIIYGIDNLFKQRR